MDKINSTNLKNNGYVFINKNNKIKNFNKIIKKIILKHKKNKKINFNNLEIDNFERLVFQIQNEINRKYPPKKFFEDNKEIFSKTFDCKEFALQHYFYLRAVKNSNKKNTKPISFHRDFSRSKIFQKYL